MRSKLLDQYKYADDLTGATTAVAVLSDGRVDPNA